MGDTVLLGAGASAEADLPVATALTSILLGEADKAERDESDPRWIRLLRFVVGGLLFRVSTEGHTGRNPLAGGVNVEEVINALLALRDRSSAEFNPFVGSWHPVLSQIEAPPPIADRLQDVEQAGLSETWLEFTKDLALDGENMSGAARHRPLSALIKYVAKLIDYAREGEASHSIYERALKWMVDQLVGRLCRVGNVDYLCPLVQASAESQLVIATLNYDQTIELAGQKCNVQVQRAGPIHEHLRNHEWEVDHARLIKLHGSVDWFWSEPGQGGPRAGEEYVLSYQEGQHPAQDLRPALLFGGANKLTAKGPFLELLGLFERTLWQSNRLVVIGYSFQDDHVNQMILRWSGSQGWKEILIANRATFDLESVPFIATIDRRPKGPGADRFRACVVQNLHEDAGEAILQLYGNRAA